jgi:energy-coupling factor transport system permease protein
VIASLYLARKSWIHQLNPLTKLSIAAFLLVGGLILPGVWSTYILLVLVVFPLALIGRVYWELVRSAIKITLPFAISVFLIQGFLWTNGTPVFWIGPFSLKLEGLRFAIASTGRILMVVSSFTWFAFTTRPDVLMSTLSQHGLPPSLAYIIVSTVQIVPRFQSRAASILDAQRARGLETEGNFIQRTRAVIPLVVALILSSLIDVEERALAIESRAFNHPGRKTSLIEIQEASWEPVARWFLAVGALGWIGLRLWLL